MMDLIEAAKSGDVRGLRRLHLATETADVNFRCPPDGATALYWAACNGHVAACDWLIRHSAEVNLTTEKSGSTPLHGAADRGHTDCVQVLLRRGADVRLVTKSNGDTPLHLAAYRGHVDICRLLLELGACADVLNKQGRTPMQEAQIKSHYDVFQLISKFRSDSSCDRARSLSSSTCELDSIRRHSPPHPIEELKMISEPIYIISTSCSSQYNDARLKPDDYDDKDVLSRHHHHHRRHHHHCDNRISNVLPWLDDTVDVITDTITSPIQHPPPKSSPTGHQYKAITPPEVDHRSPEVVHSDRKVTRREDVILCLVRRLSSLTSYILSLEARLAGQEGRLADLALEKEALTKARLGHERALQELQVERRLNAELRDRMREAEREMERMRSRGTTTEGRGVTSAGNT